MGGMLREGISPLLNMHAMERERGKGQNCDGAREKKEEIPFARNTISLLHHHHVCRGRHFFVFQRKRKDKCAKWKHFFAKEEGRGEKTGRVEPV